MCPSLYLLSLAAYGRLSSFPTRRSSDLGPRQARSIGRGPQSLQAAVAWCQDRQRCRQPLVVIVDRDRSEEHTSELQSRFELICRRVLEKKKKSIGWNAPRRFEAKVDDDT